MEHSPLGSIEELARCSCCRRAFDADERAPKLLACKHHFCLACARSVLGAGTEIYCVHCWKRTAPPDGNAERLPTHGPVLALARRLQTLEPEHQEIDEDLCLTHALPALWCVTCGMLACRACGEHATHTLRPPAEARAMLVNDARVLQAELTALAQQQRDTLVRALEATTALKLRLEAELATPVAEPELPAVTSLPAAAEERERLRSVHAAAMVRCRLEDVAHRATVPLDFELLRQALGAVETPVAAANPNSTDPLLQLANYCTAVLFLRSLGSGTIPARPLFYFLLEVDGCAFGRVVVAVRDDAAPRMARNFAALATGELGVSYRGCSVFQCWDGESVITGDFEQNNGRGGRSVFAEGYFMPDDSRLAAVRGAVGMRRSQKRRDQQGLVGSQFRIVLREMRGFTAIFGAVVEGLELVDRLSRAGDSAGKPHSTILISGCGRLL